MAYAAMIVDAGPDAGAEPRLALAAALAARFDAALIGVAAAPVQMPMSYDGNVTLVGELLRIEETRAADELAAAEIRFRAAIGAARAGRSEWCAAIDHPASTLAREARSADLLILGRDGLTDAGDVVMRAGRPVLLVPPDVSALQARHVVVAWKDAAASRRAVADALPLLRRAETVLVLEVPDRADAKDPDSGSGVDAVVRLLARHGVTAEGEMRPLRKRSVSEELAAAARERGADLIVAGGYGHARLLEWAFGGVTRDLLASCPVCCLLSH